MNSVTLPAYARLSGAAASADMNMLARNFPKISPAQSVSIPHQTS